MCATEYKKGTINIFQYNYVFCSLSITLHMRDIQGNCLSLTSAKLFVTKFKALNYTKHVLILESENLGSVGKLNNRKSLFSCLFGNRSVMDDIIDLSLAPPLTVFLLDKPFTVKSTKAGKATDFPFPLKPGSCKRAGLVITSENIYLSSLFRHV